MTEAFRKEIRYYKGKYRVEVLKKSKGNWKVRALERIHYGDLFQIDRPRELWFSDIEEDQEFTTVPRLLWRHKRQ